MAEAAARSSGRVKWFDPARGYGFIATDDYRDVFLHVSQWTEAGEPQKGQPVSFIEDNDRRGPFARQIVISRTDQ